VKLVRVMVIALVPLAPWLIVTGAAASEKFGPVPTVRLSVAVRVPVIPVAVPVIVIGYVPAGTAAPTVMFAVLVAPVAAAGLRATVTFAGWPLAVRLTVPVKVPSA
jgi:hypothetical protein